MSDLGGIPMAYDGIEWHRTVEIPTHVAHSLSFEAQEMRRDGLLAMFFCEEDVDRMLSVLGLAIDALAAPEHRCWCGAEKNAELGCNMCEVDA